MKAIRTELGEGDERSEDVGGLRKRIKKAKMPKDIEKETKKQLERLDMMHPDAVESTMLRTYIEWLVLSFHGTNLQKIGWISRKQRGSPRRGPLRSRQSEGTAGS